MLSVYMEAEQARLKKLGARERNTNEGPHVQGPHFIPRQESP